MKKNYYKIIGLIIALTCITSVNAKTLVKLKINHKMGDMAYAKNTQSTNNLGQNYDINRLEYYVSNIIVGHDGGALDTIKNKILLINPSGSFETYTLDSLNFTTIEFIQFSIGVDPIYNHSNPTGYAPGHPLAPKSPTMHWGWTAGYRFVAIEGKSGTKYDKSMTSTYLILNQ